MASAATFRVVSYLSFRHVYPLAHVLTLDAKKLWIWAADIVRELKKTVSLMMLPGLNPTSVAGRMAAFRASVVAVTDAADEVGWAAAGDAMSPPRRRANTVATAVRADREARRRPFPRVPNM